MPGSLEEYFQEAGRAGRDSRKAYAVALCTDADSFQLKKRINDEFPEKRLIRQVYEALGDYYQIPEGRGKDIIHEFALVDFCSACQLPPLQVHHALKLLELSGYIEYSEAVDEPFSPTAARITYTHPRMEKKALVIPAPLSMRNALQRMKKRISKWWNIWTGNVFAETACYSPISEKRIWKIAAVAISAFPRMIPV